MTDSAITEVTLYTDGACRGNPGPGGWGAILRHQSTEKLLYGGELLTTNNRMEMMAAIEGLKALKRPCKVRVYTDSKYLMQGMQEWLASWKRNQWKNSKKEPVKNMDLWQELDRLAAQHAVSWSWVKGHSGHPENEAADALANKAIDELLAR